MNQWLDLGTLRLGELDHLGSSPYSMAQLQQMNDRFVAAMAAAIRAGLERPSRVGIDRTPGTKNPSCYVPTRR
jgi:hypothetical protein